nr:MarR family winged helix-turn-helix transcriptional regulator [Actinomycetota bacterium]
MTDDRFGDDSYRELLALQDELRRFLSWRDARAATAGLSSGQHQLLLAIRGHRGPSEPTIGDVAEHLSLRHHSAVELVQRAEAAGLLLRRLDETDRRRVRLALSETGRRVLEALEPLHAEELRRLSSGVGTLADGIAHASRLPRERRTAAHPPRHASSRGTRGTRGTGATRGTRGTRGTGGT